METRAAHLLAEYHGCDQARLDDDGLVEQMMRRAAAAAGATIVAECFHRFSPQGVTGVVVVEESHLSIHTWPEHGYAAVDFFTCGACDPEAAHRVIADALGARRAELLTVERGLAAARSMRVGAHRVEGA